MPRVNSNKIFALVAGVVALALPAALIAWPCLGDVRQHHWQRLERILVFRSFTMMPLVQLFQAQRSLCSSSPLMRGSSIGVHCGF